MKNSSEQMEEEMNDTTDFQMVIIRIAVITFIAGGIASTLGVGPFDNSYTPTPYAGDGGAHEPM